MYSERMRYLGVLGLLGECAVYVPEELREQIETAMEHACSDGRLKWRRVLDRIEIESNPNYVPPKSETENNTESDKTKQEKN